MSKHTDVPYCGICVCVWVCCCCCGLLDHKTLCSLRCYSSAIQAWVYLLKTNDYKSTAVCSKSIIFPGDGINKNNMTIWMKLGQRCKWINTNFHHRCDSPCVDSPLAFQLIFKYIISRWLLDCNTSCYSLHLFLCCVFGYFFIIHV